MLSARFRPKSCRRSGAGKQHGADLLKLIDDIDLIAAVDMAEGVVAAGSPGGVERVEEQRGLAQIFEPKTSGGVPVFLLYVEHDHRIWPLQQVRDDNAHALAGTGRGFEQDMLGSAKAQELTRNAAQQNARILHQLCLAHLADMGPARLAVELLLSEHRGSDADQADHEGEGEAAKKRFPHDRRRAQRP
jgi:hypothetical protein